TSEARNCLEEYNWPGNVRELQSVLRYALIRSAGEVLTLDCLPENLRATPSDATTPSAFDTTLDVAQLTTNLLRAGGSDSYRRICMAVDRVVMETVLRHAKGNQVQASELLGISRTTLRAKLRALRMSVEKSLLPEANSSQEDEERLP